MKIKLSEVNEFLEKLRDEKSKINHPKHYQNGSIETIDIIKENLTEAEFRGFLKGNCIKYLSRETKKNGIEDLKKCQWYLERLIQDDENKKTD